MHTQIQIINIDASNVEQNGFFCYMSKRKSAGYRQKRDWLEKRFAEGMKIKIIHETGGRDVAFIEYIPGEYAWRVVQAPGYLVIHCLWVVGKGKKKGYGSRLLVECMEDARAQGKHGVAMVCSDGNWLAGKKLFLHNGFVPVDQAPPAFQLLVQRFGSAPEPGFPQDWQERLDSYGSGLTIVRTDQCPYIENASAGCLQSAGRLGIATRVVQMVSARQVQETAPCAYGAFGIVYNGRLLGYHYLDEERLKKALDSTE